MIIAADQQHNGILLVGPFWEVRIELADRLLMTDPFNAGTWQKLDISESSDHDTYELLNVTLWLDIPDQLDQLQSQVEPDLPWAERHFQERVGGHPINPGVEHANWPYHAGQVDLHLNGGQYDHNYMERMWAKGLTCGICSADEQIAMPFHGYRFDVGDLDSVVTLLADEPATRQAYLPIWFPEDTGAQDHQRVPCSLGYHFIIRDNQIHVQYNLRSCEIYRHFTNDVYMAMRLGQWVRDRLAWETAHMYEMGQLTFHAVSFHGFVGDYEKIKGLAYHED